MVVWRYIDFLIYYLSLLLLYLFFFAAASLFFFLVFRSFFLFLCTVLKIVDVEKNVKKFFSEHRFNQHSIDKQT